MSQSKLILSNKSSRQNVKEISDCDTNSISTSNDKYDFIEQQIAKFDSFVTTSTKSVVDNTSNNSLDLSNENDKDAEMSDSVDMNITNTDEKNSECFSGDDKEEMEDKFVLVKFLDCGSLAIIPSNWFMELEGQCLWPEYKAGRLETAVKKLESPAKSPIWKRYDVALKKKFATYDTAQKGLKDYEYSLCFTSATKLVIKEERENTCKYTESHNSDLERNHQRIKRRKISEIQRNDELLHSTDENSAVQFNDGIQTSKLFDHLVNSTAALNSLETHSILNNEQLLPSVAGTNELGGNKFLELACMLLKNQQRLDHKINELRKEINTKINFIIQSIPQINHFHNEKQFLARFPLASTEDFDNIDKILDDPENADALVSYLSPAAGPTVRNCVNGMMKLLLNDSLCTEIGLTSKNRKRSFQDTNLMKVLHNAIARRCCGLTTKELHCCVGEWFRRYKDRLYGRRRPSEIINKENST